jgi:hypothetical protein
MYNNEENQENDVGELAWLSFWIAIGVVYVIPMCICMLACGWILKPTR